MTMRSAFAAPRAEFRLPACRRRGSPASSPLPPDGAPVPIRGDSLGTSSFASTVTISQPHEHDAASKAERRSSRRHDRCAVVRYVRRTFRYRLHGMPVLRSTGRAGTRQHMGRRVVHLPSMQSRLVRSYSQRAP